MRRFTARQSLITGGFLPVIDSPKGILMKEKAPAASSLAALSGDRVMPGLNWKSPITVSPATTNPAPGFPPGKVSTIAGRLAARSNACRARRRCARCAMVSAPTAARGGFAGIKTSDANIALAPPPAASPTTTVVRNIPSPAKSGSGNRQPSRSIWNLGSPPAPTAGRIPSTTTRNATSPPPRRWSPITSCISTTIPSGASSLRQAAAPTGKKRIRPALSPCSATASVFAGTT